MITRKHFSLWMVRWSCIAYSPVAYYGQTRTFSEIISNPTDEKKWNYPLLYSDEQTNRADEKPSLTPSGYSLNGTSNKS